MSQGLISLDTLCRGGKLFGTLTPTQLKEARRSYHVETVADCPAQHVHCTREFTFNPLTPQSFFKFWHIFAYIFVQKYHLSQFHEIGH